MKVETENGKLRDLVEWCLQDMQVEIKFIPNEKRKGKIAPEVDFQYWIANRPITERGIAFLILDKLLVMGYGFMLSRVVAALTAISFACYLRDFEYTEWLRIGATPVMKRPQGRPRKNPPKICVPTYTPNFGNHK